MQFKATSLLLLALAQFSIMAAAYPSTHRQTRRDLRSAKYSEYASENPTADLPRIERRAPQSGNDKGKGKQPEQPKKVTQSGVSRSDNVAAGNSFFGSGSSSSGTSSGSGSPASSRSNSPAAPGSPAGGPHGHGTFLDSSSRSSGSGSSSSGSSSSGSEGSRSPDRSPSPGAGPSGGKNQVPGTSKKHSKNVPPMKKAKTWHAGSK